MEEISEIAGSFSNYEVQDSFENSPSYEIQNLSGNTTEFTGSKYSNMETGSTSSITDNSKSSQVWLHFTKDANYKTNKIAICNYCSKKYMYSKESTSNIILVEMLPFDHIPNGCHSALIRKCRIMYY